MAKILILDAIDSYWGVSASDIVNQVNAVPEGEAIDIVINSPGGYVFDGLTIYHALNNHKGDKNVEIYGMAASMASVIAMAGTNISIGEGAMVMVHDPLSGIWGNAEELRKEAGVLDQIRDSIVNIYHRVTGKSKDELKQMMADETWLTADEAVAHGFAKAKIDGGTVQNISKRFAAVAGAFGKIPEAAKKLLNVAEKPVGVAPVKEPEVKPAVVDVAKVAADERVRVQAIMALKMEGFDVQPYIDSGASVDAVKVAAYDVLTGKIAHATKQEHKPSELIALLTSVGALVQTPVPDAQPINKQQKFLSLNGVERTKYFRANMCV